MLLVIESEGRTGQTDKQDVKTRSVTC